MSIRDVTINLDGRGMTLILGENKDNINFDNNGAGKSTITEALTYVLYGRTLRGLKGDEVVNRNSKKNCRVMLDFVDDDGSEYRISRYRKHKDNGNKFFLFRNKTDITPKSEADFTQAIVDILNMDFLTFTSSILYSAQSFKFTTATDAEMKNAFDTMLGLNLYTDCLEETKSQLRGIEHDFDVYTAKIDALNSQIESSKEEIKETNELCDKYEDKKKQELHEIQQEIDEASKELKDLNSQVASNRKSVDKAKSNVKKQESLCKKAEEDCAELEQIREGIDGCKDELRNNQVSQSKVKSDIKQTERNQQNDERQKQKLMREIQSLQNKIEEASSTVGSKCPTCGSTITEESVESVIQSYNEQIKQVFSEVSECDKSIKDNNKELQELNKSLKEFKEAEDSISQDKEVLEDALENSDAQAAYNQAVEDLNKAKRACDSAENTLSMSVKEVEHKQHEIDRLNSQYTSKSDEENPYVSIIKMHKEKIQKMTKDIKSIQDDMKDLETQKQVLSFWMIGFSNSGIKSLLLDDITPFLNRRTNKYLRKLSSDHMEVQFSTQTKLKSGEMREKFSINVINQDGGESYIANSSGEKRRVDIAVNLALQDLISSRSSKKLNIAFLDEVLDTLDESGVDNVMELLQEISKDKSSLFVITHNSALKEQFTNSITMVKEDGYSRLVEV
jgi:DNA repair exonuclease SbcCD ATPase subunit